VAEDEPLAHPHFTGQTRWKARCDGLGEHKGIARALLEYAMPLTGAQRIDLVTDTAEAFYAALPHHTFSGFRIYPGWKDTDA